MTGDLRQLREARRILFVIQFLAMGDAVLLSPVFRVIKSNVSGVELTLLTTRYAVPIVRAIPDVDHVYPLEDIFRPGSSRLERLFRLCAFVLRGRFDTIVLRDDRRFPERTCHLAARICCLKTVSLGPYLEEEVIANRHIVDTYLRILERGGFQVGDRRRLYLSVPESAIAQAKALLNGSRGKLAGFAPLGQWRVKNWTPEKAAQLICRLQALAYDVVLFCSDREYSATVQGLAPNGRLRVVSHVEFSLLMGILSMCAIFVGVDTGPTHVAAALGVPTVGLYGPTSGIVSAPYSSRGTAVQTPVACPYFDPVAPYSPRAKFQECHLDGRCRLPMVNCAEQIDVDSVIRAIETVAR